MKMLMITAMQSGAGKTVMSCAVMAALKNRGVRLQAYKCGPDYIDPMFHREALGIPSRNLDLFLQGEAGIRRTLQRSEAEFGILEAAMGYYDGLNGTDQASAWELARKTDTPAVLVLRPKGAGLSLAAQVCGILKFRPESGICGLLLNDCTPQQAQYFRSILERETGLPVLGVLPPMKEAKLESRHLGLLTAEEIADLSLRLKHLAAAAEEYIDLDRLLSLASSQNGIRKKERGSVTPARCRIAVARDEAFCFLYADNLDALREAGAELCFFSPIHDSAMPEAVSGLYLPGGYPELYAEALSKNSGMRQQLAKAVAEGLPTVAECGGFLYLQQSLEAQDGSSFPMCAALPGRGFPTGRLQRFGYQLLTAERDSLLFREGERIPAHEFHYWDSTENGNDLSTEKADGRSWRCGYTGKTLYAGFPHLHFGGAAPLAERFERACEAWKQANWI